jgi:ParB/RepB/Spo0J family partition protein
MESQTLGTTAMIQKIPISQIKPNPNNPRHVIKSEMVDACAASMQAVGQRTPIKVKGSGDTSYELIGGHIRLAAAQKLGLETLDALLLDLTPEQALLEAILDNRGQELTWLDEYQTIESMLKVNPNLTQREIADQLEMSLGMVNRGIKLLKLLNQASRDILVQNLNKTEDSEEVKEYSVFRLTDLTESKAFFFSGDTEEAHQNDLQKLVERALKVVVDQKMTEPQVGKLVNYILKTGNNPESYGLHEEAQKEGSPNHDPNDSNTDLWENLPKNFKIHKTPSGYRVSLTLTDSEAPVGVYSTMAGLAKLKDPYDPQWEQAIPGFLELAKASLKAEQEAQTQAETQRQQDLVQKTQAADEAKKIAKERNLKQAQVALEGFKPGLKIKIDTFLGSGPLANMIYQAIESGNKSKALSLAEEALSHTDKPEPIRKAFLEQVEADLKRLRQLKKAAGVKKQESNPDPIPASSIQTSNPPLETAGSGESQINSTQAPAPTSEQPKPAALLDQVKQAVKDNLHLAPGEVADALMKDGKQALNYEIRKGFRNLLKDAF